MSSRNHVLLCRVTSAAIIAAAALIAFPAYADFEGGSASQDFFNMNGVNGNISINEGQSVSVSLRMRAQPDGNQSGFAGTTTTRLTTNSVIFSRNGASGFATDVSTTGGTTDGIHDMNGSFSFGQDGVHTISFSDSVPLDAVQNSSFGLGSQTNGGSSGQSNSRTITVNNVAPTVTSATQNGTNGTITVAEGSTVALQMQSTDPGADAQTFVINGSGAGTGGTSGTRTSSVANQNFGQDGSFTNTFTVFDDDTSTTVTRNLVVTNVAPTIVSATQNGTNGSITVNEGSTVALQMQSTDPGTDAQTFTINGSSAGTGGTSGTRTSSIVNAAAADDGVLTNTFSVADDDTTTTTTQSVTVLNVAPTLFGLSVPGGTIGAGQTANFSVSASDPGVLDDLTFAWDLDGDGLFDDAITNEGSGGSATNMVTFTSPGAPPTSLGLGVRVFDGDGGQDTILFNVIVPEPATVVMMGIGAIGLGLIARRRRKQA